ncbi:MAG: MMPL family transporter [Pseudomonadales bacterium]
MATAMQARNLLERWVGWISKHAAAVLVALVGGTALALWVAVDRFAINADLGGLIDQEAAWRTDFDRYERAFPDRINTLVVLVRGDSFFNVEQATRRIEGLMRADREHFRSVYAAGVDPFFRDHALLYMDADTLDDMVDRLATAQPLLATVSADPTLRGLLDRLTQGLNESGSELDDHDLSANRVLELLEQSADALLDGADPTIIWTDELFASDSGLVRVINAKGALDPLTGAELSKAEVMRAAQTLLGAMDIPLDVSVSLTGEVALAHEEISAATAGVQTAGWLSVLLLLGVLIIGVRSGKIIVGTFALLLTGVIWTSAYAMLTVGEYNTLSIVFLVMFFGLGVDFAVHFSLRYQEAINFRLQDQGSSTATRSSQSVIIASALLTTVRSVGKPICLCALTTAIAFLGFWPTNYQGLADLGVISAGGMVIAGFLTFTLLPAYYQLVGRIRHHNTALTSSSRLVHALTRRRVMVVVVLAICVAVAAVGARQSYFDYSVLALRDDQSGSMQALRTLQNEGLATDYSLSVLLGDPGVPAVLTTLPEVAEVVSAVDYLPADQTAKLEVLADAQDIFWDLLEPQPPVAAPGVRDTTRSLAALIDALRAQDAQRYQGLIDDLSDIANTSEQRLNIWQRAVLSNLQEELAWLRRALQVQGLVFEDLPRPLQSQLRSPAGEYLLQINPAEDLSDTASLNRFIAAVKVHIPAATGRPVIEWGVGQIVVEAFMTATAIALAGVLLILILRYRRLMDAVIILIPLMVALVFTLAAGVWFERPLNMASVLVLPLIFGLGVDNGIHVVDRFHASNDVSRLIHSSTPRAVLLSTLTTIGAFASLMLSPHQGTASIGFLLTLAVSLVLLLTVFVLPVLLSFFARPAAGPGA